MENRLVDLPIALSRHAPPTRIARLIEDAARIAADLKSERGPERIPTLETSNGRIAWEFLQAAKPHITTKTPRFCEWGSGIGIVTSLARCLGWQAMGIDIEPRLVAIARQLAASHALDVQFHQCSYKPDALFNPGSAASDLDTGLGFGLLDFDVIYVYPWPAERDALIRAIGRHARDGTILLVYGGGITCEAFRVTGDVSLEQ